MCWLEIRFKLHFSVNSSDGLGIIRRQQLRGGGGGGGGGVLLESPTPTPPPHTRK